ncbi:MAG TPA: hypothetical protein VE093_38810 [Polyangiaceae bacterium]|jgi:hypothetical protein|nr:hypothetical protein [Polyangiaceae bacterium]
MGKGAYLNVTNASSKAVFSTLTQIHCVYNGGSEGSNPGLFDKVSIPSHTYFPGPKGGRGQYIEAKASSSGGDTCATDRSYFTLSFVAQSGPVHIQFSEESNTWTAGAPSDGTDIQLNAAATENGDVYDLVVTITDNF